MLSSMAGVQKRIISALDDARSSLACVTTAPMYKTESGPAAIQEVRDLIDTLERQLSGLDVE